MRRLIKTLGWAFAFFVALASASSALAAVANLPAVQLTVNGEPVQLASDVNLVDTNLWLAGFEGAGAGWSLTNGIAAFSTDPFLDYSFDVKNFSNQTLSFIVLLTTPFSDGPYGLLTSSHTSTVSDSLVAPDGTVTIGTNGSAFVQTTQIDNVDVPLSGISNGCFQVGTPGFSDLDCQSHLTTNANVSTLANGTLGIRVAFTVSAHDSFHAEGSADLLSAVPEPHVNVLLASGLLLLFAAVARRRTH